MPKPGDNCPKHGVSYVIRRNGETGEIAIACPLCDVEARGGTDEDVNLVAEEIAMREHTFTCPYCGHLTCVISPMDTILAKRAQCENCGREFSILNGMAWPLPM